MPQAPNQAPARSGRFATLGDFTTDRRVFTLTLMAVFVGTAGAFSAWFLLTLIKLATNIAWYGTWFGHGLSMAGVKPSIWVIVIPVVGSLVVGLMARYGSEKIRGHGIPEALEAILISKSRVEPKVAILKPLGSAIAIGTGGPFGAEGPIIMTGGAIGSLFAQFFNLTAAERKTLLVAGAVAGMDGVFGTPFAAVLLAVELMLFEWKPRSLIPVIVSVVVAQLWRPVLIATGPLFPYTVPTDLPVWCVFIAVGVGTITGVQAGVLSMFVYKMEDLFKRLPFHWMWWPMIGGLAIGIGGLIEPRAMGVGYDVIRDYLTPGHMMLLQATLILVVKSVIWGIALASGTSGSMLAPMLVMGGAAGFLEGHLLPGGPGLWALAGMAGMMAGAMHAPLTGVAFAVELTGDYHVIGILLPAVAASYLVTVLLLRRSIVTEKLARRGQHLTREYTTDPFETTRVSDVMVREVNTLPATMSVEDAVAFFTEDEGHRHKSYPIVDEEGRVVGMAARADVMRWRTAAENGNGAHTLFDTVSDSNLVVAYPDEILAWAADLMAETDHGRIPVVDRTSQKLVGLIARKDLLRMRLASNAAERERASYLGYRQRRAARPADAGATSKGS